MIEMTAQAETTTVLLCDDHGLFREGARRILDDEPDLRVVADAASIEEALPLAETTAPDILVLDISFPNGATGLDAIEAFRLRCPSTRVLIVSMHRDRSFIDAAFAHGAMGYVSKDAAADDLAAAVRVVALGGRYVREVPEHRPRTNGTRVTIREREVLELVALGHTNPEIAQLLYLSPRTVESYRSQLSRKFGVKGRAELIRVARERGLI